MKSSAIFLSFATIFMQVVSQPLNDNALKSQLSPLQEQCVTELHLEEKRNEIENFNSRTVCPENNQEYNDFISCFWKKSGRQAENGEINYDVLKSFVYEGLTQALGTDSDSVAFADQQSQNIIKECKKLSEISPIKVRNCIVQELNELGE